MKNKIYLTVALLATVLSTACSINHPIAIDYDKHLVKYGSETVLPTTGLESEYLIDSETINHSYQFRAASVGYAHVWIVEIGKILDKTLNAEYVQKAFGKFEKSVGESDGNVVEFTLENYEFKSFHAFLTMKIDVVNNGKSIFSKTYKAEGAGQAGQMFMAGPFGMKNSTLKSTKQAIDKILAEFITDINTEKLASN